MDNIQKPLLTIGISFYNTADTLEDLVRCIFAQTFQDWELILVDDGSTDNGFQVVEKIKDSRVRLIRHEENLGRSFRYNQIAELAKGKYIARLDADDMSTLDRFEKQISFLEAHPEIDVVSSDLISLDENERVRGRCYNPTNHEEICSNMLKRIYIAHAPIVGRKKWFLEHGYPEQFKIAVDYALFLSSYNTSRFASIPEPLYICREYVTHSLSKYTRTSLSVMKIIWTYGRETHSLPAVFLAILYYNAKVLIYVAATILGCHRKLISRRMEVAGKSDQELFEQAIKIIRLTTVPGLQRYVKTG